MEFSVFHHFLSDVLSALEVLCDDRKPIPDKRKDFGWNLRDFGRLGKKQFFRGKHLSWARLCWNGQQKATTWWRKLWPFYSSYEIFQSWLRSKDLKRWTISSSDKAKPISAQKIFKSKREMKPKWDLSIDWKIFWGSNDICSWRLCLIFSF